MDKKDLRRIKAQEAATKDKRRIIFAVGGLVLCITVLVALNKKASQAEEDAAKQIQSDRTSIMELLPELDQSILDNVRDSTYSEQGILEIDALQELGSKVRTLLPSWFYVLGEPEFDFSGTEADAPELRGKLFRMRGELLDARPLTRDTGSETEYWCHIRNDAGEEFLFVSMTVPTELFGADNFVLADGYFLKYYRHTLTDTPITAPLFIGRELSPSWRNLEPSLEPDMELMARVKDQPLGTDNRVENLNTLPAMWHLANVAESVRATPETLAAATTEPLVIDYEMLEKLSKDPEIYRGRMFEVGGMYAGTPATVRIGENPMRERKMSSAWIRNDFNGDVLVHLKAPGQFDFDTDRDPVVFHAYFLMLWAYVDTKGIPRRAPVFVVVDNYYDEPYTPPFAGQMVMMFLGIAVAIGCLLFWLVKRDRLKSELVMQEMLDRRQNRSKS
jgi:hypothetical protein